jgi:branched-subunit amino acid transport protein
MIIPLVGLFIACAIFACIGAAVLTLIPHLRRTLSNVGSFVIGAVPSSAFAAIAYGRVFGNQTGELDSTAVVGLFGVLLLAGVCGGLLAVFAYTWLMRTIRLQRESGSSGNR